MRVGIVSEFRHKRKAGDEKDGHDSHSRDLAQTRVSVPHLPCHGDGHCSWLKQEQCGTDTPVCAGTWQALIPHLDSPKVPDRQKCLCPAMMGGTAPARSRTNVAQTLLS